MLKDNFNKFCLAVIALLVLLSLLFTIRASAEEYTAPEDAAGSSQDVPAGRDDVLNGDSSTAETAQSGDDLKDAFNNYGGKLPGIIDEVKQAWEEVFSGFAGVLKFLADTIGGIFAILPASYTVYIVMLCLCIAISAIIKVLTE